MYRWYTDAQVCYAFLSDVDVISSVSYEPRTYQSGFEEYKWAFRTSMWFTRGWTLQELLAPANLVFFDVNWIEIGTKSSLASSLASITGVKIEHLFDIHSASVAQKMSWAAARETTRLEDQAYCLMGLFQVNMPPLYGEGERAFERLQQEILKTSDDASIFAWTDHSEVEWQGGSGLLATSPALFLSSGAVVPSSSRHFKSAYSMTNRGLQMETPLLFYKNSLMEREIFALERGELLSLWKLNVPGQERSFAVPLACTFDGERLAVQLRLNPGSEDQFHRYPGQTLISMIELYELMQNLVEKKLEARPICIKPFDGGLDASQDSNTAPGHQRMFNIRINGMKDYGYTLVGWSIRNDDGKVYTRNGNHTFPTLGVSGTFITWEPTPSSSVSSLRLVFNKNSRDESGWVVLQIYTYGKRAGLEITFGKERDTQHTWDRGRSRQDRVSKTFLGGRVIHAAVNAVARAARHDEHSFGRTANINAKEPILLVDIGISGGVHESGSQGTVSTEGASEVAELSLLEE